MHEENEKAATARAHIVLRGASERADGEVRFSCLVFSCSALSEGWSASRLFSALVTQIVVTFLSFCMCALLHSDERRLWEANLARGLKWWRSKYKHTGLSRDDFKLSGDFMNLIMSHEQ